MSTERTPQPGETWTRKFSKTPVEILTEFDDAGHCAVKYHNDKGGTFISVARRGHLVDRVVDIGIQIPEELWVNLYPGGGHSTHETRHQAFDSHASRAKGLARYVRDHDTEVEKY